MQMTDLVTVLKNWRNRRRQNEWSNKLKEIKDSFQVKELNGTIYLMCQGVPYKQVPNNATASEITTLLNEARSSMRAYLESEGKDVAEEEPVL